MQSHSTSYETAGSFNSNLDKERVNYRVELIKEFVEEGSNLSQTNINSSNVTIGNSALINTNSNFNLEASNFAVENNLEILANNNQTLPISKKLKINQI